MVERILSLLIFTFMLTNSLVTYFSVPLSSHDSSSNSSRAVEYVSREVLVKFKSSINYTLEMANLSNIIEKELRRYKLLDLSLVRIKEGIGVEEALNLLRNNQLVEYAEPNYIFQVDQIFPNDPLFQYQWGLYNIGQLGGTVDADVDAPEAWNITTGSGSLVIAIIDTGLDYTHVDISSNVWLNPFETVNGIDDDGNGYVDDIHGVDTCNNDGDPMDDHGHGTAVAGVIAALGNNGIGVAGINWHIKIMVLKFACADGAGSTSSAIEALEYVMDMKRRGINVKVTNNSWGGGGFSRALYDTIAALQAMDILFVASAGNNGRNNDLEPHYPSSYNLSNIISVAATDNKDNLAWFSNWGQSSVDLGAPGQGIITTLPANWYGYLSGTSMATAYVSGGAALILSINAAYSYQELKRLILNSVDRVPSLNGYVRSGGRLNLYKSLVQVYIDLSRFPFPFVSGGVADYAMVLGDSFGHGCFSLGARTVDVLGSALVSARLGLDSEGGLPELFLDTEFTSCSGNTVSANWDKVTSSSVIAVGGPGVNMLVYRYNGSLPFKWIYRPPSVSSIYSELTGRTYSSVWGREDYLVLAVVVDGDSGKTVLTVWGLTGYGTMAGTLLLGYYDRFRDILAGKAVLLRWEDSNNNGKADINDTLALMEVWRVD
jgi:subtilisin family serine protease